MSSRDRAQRQVDLPAQQRRYEEFKAQAMSLDMTRGKPCPEQLDLSLDLLTVLGRNDFVSDGGVDCRNYGGVEGLPEARQLFGDFLDVQASEVLIGGNSSLTLMHDSVARALTHGVPGGSAPWQGQSPKFLCPSPGYDRHFAICEHLGIEMIVVDMLDDGPDVDAISRLVADDPSVKGVWIVPKYSNPTGVTLSASAIERLAQMPTAAPDFRILWDNAYAVHHLTDTPDEIGSILAACKEAGHPDRVWLFASTSKITFAGAGLSAMGGSEQNIAWMVGHRSKMTIGPDKLNQLRHLRFLRDMDGIRAHMRKHAAIIRPKFDAVDRVLTEELGGSGLAEWTRPAGGYFISLDTPDGCAKQVVDMASDVGVKLTSAGATFPYGRDPRDRNIRIAPTLPAIPEIETAMRVLATCIRIASAESQAR